MRVADYAPDEVADDEHSANWDQALDEVENGEKIRQEKIQKERPNLYALIQQNMDEFKMLLTEGLNINFGSEQAQPLPTADEVFSYLGERRR